MSLSLRTPPFDFPSFTIPHPWKCKTRHFPCFCTPKYNSSSSRSRRKKSSIITGAPDLAAEVMQRVKSQADKKENALKRSKQMLFFELCNSLNVSPEEGKRMWGRMSPDEKMGLIEGFVSDWGLRFHPLSPSSVRDMVEEYVAADAEEGDSSEKNPDLGLTGSSFDAIFSGLKKFFMVLSQDD